MDGKAHSEGKLSPLSVVLSGPGTERGHSVKEWVRVCFSCGRQGHRVNRCSQVDTFFTLLPPGWSVNVRNGQNRATQTDGTGVGVYSGKREMVRAGGSASRTIRDRGATDPSGELLVRGDVSRLGSCR